jgi:hypothetical protein
VNEFNGFVIFVQLFVYYSVVKTFSTLTLETIRETFERGWAWRRKLCKIRADLSLVFGQFLNFESLKNLSLLYYVY